MKKPRKNKRLINLQSAFRQAKIRLPGFQAQGFRRPEDTLIFNRATPEMVRAFEEIRWATTMWGGGIRTINVERIPRSPNWSDTQQEVWTRFVEWTRYMKKNKKAMKSTMLFVAGYRFREIEEMLKMRHGSARRRILEGAKEYGILHGWLKKYL